MAVPSLFLIYFIVNMTTTSPNTELATTTVDRRMFSFDPTRMLTDEEYARERVLEVLGCLKVPCVHSISMKILEMARHVYEGRPAAGTELLPCVTLSVWVDAGIVTRISTGFDRTVEAQVEIDVVDFDDGSTDDED